ELITAGDRLGGVLVARTGGTGAGSDTAGGHTAGGDTAGGDTAGGDTQVIGVLGYSVPAAIRLGGRYCLIQELWVSPEHRRRGLPGTSSRTGWPGCALACWRAARSRYRCPRRRRHWPTS